MELVKDDPRLDQSQADAIDAGLYLRAGERWHYMETIIGGSVGLHGSISPPDGEAAAADTEYLGRS